MGRMCEDLRCVSSGSMKSTSLLKALTHCVGFMPEDADHASCAVCLICYEPLVDATEVTGGTITSENIAHCPHHGRFHPSCLSEWKRVQACAGQCPTCPVCRVAYDPTFDPICSDVGPPSELTDLEEADRNREPGYSTLTGSGRDGRGDGHRGDGHRVDAAIVAIAVVAGTTISITVVVLGLIVSELAQS